MPESATKCGDECGSVWPAACFPEHYQALAHHVWRRHSPPNHADRGELQGLGRAPAPAASLLAAVRPSYPRWGGAPRQRGGVSMVSKITLRSVASDYVP